MQPDIDAQLSIVRNTLQQVVLPALDPANKPAGEQLQLSIKTLDACLALLPYRRKFVREQLKLGIAMADELLAVLRDEKNAAITALTEANRAAQNAYGDVDLDTEDLSRMIREILARTNDVVVASKQSPLYPMLSKTILQRSAPLVALSRAWCSDTGLEETYTLDWAAKNI